MDYKKIDVTYRVFLLEISVFQESSLHGMWLLWLLISIHYQNKSGTPVYMFLVVPVLVSGVEESTVEVTTTVTVTQGEWHPLLWEEISVVTVKVEFEGVSEERRESNGWGETRDLGFLVFSLIRLHYRGGRKLPWLNSPRRTSFLQSSAWCSLYEITV